MKKINELSLSTTIIIASIILGSFYYFTQTSNQKYIEKQKQTELQRKDCEIEISEKMKSLDKITNSIKNITPEQAQNIARKMGLIDENNYVIDKNILIKKCLKK